MVRGPNQASYCSSLENEVGVRWVGGLGQNAKPIQENAYHLYMQAESFR